ncbi:unnamed protein product [Ambrosiozyma monospora]|uniref:Unnamed protein product n=1 Tax=Ambrosiozyma monospora TaxID=43982 RepID=A0ACB5UBD5_AMBMO|nr:unnamed protein product [Ambrosiozyma monospora]
MHEQLFAGFDGAEAHRDKQDELLSPDELTFGLGLDIEGRRSGRKNESSASVARHEHYRMNSFKKSSLGSNPPTNTPSPINTLSYNAPVIKLETLSSLEEFSGSNTRSESGVSLTGLERSSSQSQRKRNLSSRNSASWLGPHPPNSTLSTRNSSQSYDYPLRLSPSLSSFDDDLVNQYKSIKHLRHKLNVSVGKIDVYHANLDETIDNNKHHR